ncbi:DUF1707 and FHA domain-containing protein [Bailinhaonella thermotolerans]|uniref:DUF1707 domain-containing protein n=1 Tax=Bailinhaonella thermotolerans TaxID=1070861 RepID=A0A3A4AAH2_9ACTN|nr:DUF1707 and FHA domain-containing protein [Bailinhaonella thermotolerans]RJL25079.1 DUF1707 domain-containing protein [Bailinhaonella thermotolerans]
MSSSPTPPPVRASDWDRDRAIDALRERAAEGQLSLDTFVGRMDQALRARSRAELNELVADLPPRGRWTRRLTDAVAAISSFSARVESAWRTPRIPRLALPGDSRTRFTIGRAPGCDLVLADLTVSRVHAELLRSGDHWLVVDLSSMNGTRLNGWRLMAPTVVRPGDELSFGESTFRLSPPLA